METWSEVVSNILLNPGERNYLYSLTLVSLIISLSLSVGILVFYSLTQLPKVLTLSGKDCNGRCKRIETVSNARTTASVANGGNNVF